MRILVTGSAGHLGEALMRTLPRSGHEAIGVDILDSPYTHDVGSIADRQFVRRSMRGVEAVLHAATLHKPLALTVPPAPPSLVGKVHNEEKSPLSMAVCGTVVVNGDPVRCRYCSQLT